MQQWDATPDYFNGRFGSKEWFGERIAYRADLGADYFSGEIIRWVQSDDYTAWQVARPTYDSYTSLDIGDYWAITGDAVFFELAIIRDDWGNGYFRFGLGPSFPGAGVARGDMAINMDPNGSPFHNLVDIDSLDISEMEKSALMRESMVGPAGGGSASGFLGFIGVGISSSLTPPHSVTVETVFAPPGASVTPWSYTWLLWNGK